MHHISRAASSHPILTPISVFAPGLPALLFPGFILVLILGVRMCCASNALSYYFLGPRTR
ncbi:hypothetical protein B0H13DRAFT_2079773, partial [Mycena leptocephala]